MPLANITTVKSFITLAPDAGNTNGRGNYHCTVDLLLDWFGISCMTNDNFCFYLQNRLIQTSQTGGQLHSDTSPFSIPCLMAEIGSWIIPIPGTWGWGRGCQLHLRRSRQHQQVQPPHPPGRRLHPLRQPRLLRRRLEGARLPRLRRGEVFLHPQGSAQHPVQERGRGHLRPQGLHPRSLWRLWLLWWPGTRPGKPTKGGSITVPLTSCLTGLDSSVLKIKTKMVSCHTADSKPGYSDTSPFSILWVSTIKRLLFCNLNCYCIIIS